MDGKIFWILLLLFKRTLRDRCSGNAEPILASTLFYKAACDTENGPFVYSRGCLQFTRNCRLYMTGVGMLWLYLTDLCIGKLKQGLTLRLLEASC